MVLATMGISMVASMRHNSAQAQLLIAPSIVSFTSYFGTRSPVNLVNGSGLTLGPSGILGDSDSTHGSDVDGTMWYSNPYIAPPDTSPIVTFDLGGVYDLQTTRLWQYNQPGGFTVYGAKNIEVSISADNTNFTVLSTITPARAGGTNGEPAQDFTTAATGVQYVRLHILDTFGGVQPSGLSEVRFVASPGHGGVTLFTNASTVQLANDLQKVSFDKSSDGKFHITTSVWDGSSWRSFFDGAHPLMEGSKFNLEPTTYSVLTNTTTKKSVRFQGSHTSPTYSFDIEVEVQSGTDLVKFQIASHFPSAVSLPSPQPTVGLWMNRPSAQLVMHQGPPSATRGAFAVDFNFGFPAAYLWDQNQEAAIFFDMTPATWMAGNGVRRFFDVQIKTFGNGTQTGLGMYPYHLSGNTLRSGEMLVNFYLYASWRPQGPARLSDMLDKMLEVFQPLHPWTPTFPTNFLDASEVSWRTTAERTITDLMLQNVTYGHRTNEPYTDSPLPLVSLPTEMIVHPSFVVSNSAAALNQWIFRQSIIIWPLRFSTRGCTIRPRPNTSCSSRRTHCPVSMIQILGKSQAAPSNPPMSSGWRFPGRRSSFIRKCSPSWTRWQRRISTRLLGVAS